MITLREQLFSKLGIVRLDNVHSCCSDGGLCTHWRPVAGFEAGDVGYSKYSRCRTLGSTMRLLLALLILWAVLAVIGFAVKSLLWLAIVALVLFFATSVYGAVRGRSRILGR